MVNLAGRPAQAGLTIVASGTSAVPVKVVIPKPAATGYRWDFGDGTSATTQSPAVAHDYFPAIQGGKVAHSFDVTPALRYPPPPSTPTNSDGQADPRPAFGLRPLRRRLGTIVPHVTGDAYARYQVVGFSGSMVVHNLEAQAIALDRMAVVAHSDDPDDDPAPPQFAAMKSAVTIKAKSASGLGVFLLTSQLKKLGPLGPSMPGFTVFYEGTAADKTPVRFSYAFRTCAEATRASPSGSRRRRWHGMPRRWSRRWRRSPPTRRWR